MRNSTCQSHAFVHEATKVQFDKHDDIIMQLQQKDIGLQASHVAGSPKLVLKPGCCCLPHMCSLSCSFRRAGQPGPLTRLLSCSDEKLKGYKWMDLMPTFAVPNVEYDEEHDDHYTAYNKPFAVAAWLRVSIYAGVLPNHQPAALQSHVCGSLGTHDQALFHILYQDTVAAYDLCNCQAQSHPAVQYSKCLCCCAEHCGDCR